MELFAAGFNPCGQLDFRESRHCKERNQKNGQSDDVYAFATLLRGEAIGRPIASLWRTMVPRNDTWIASIEGDQRVNGCSDYEEVAMTRALEPADTIRGRSRWSLQRAADERRHSPSLSSDELDFVATSPRDRRPGKGKYLAYYDAGVVILTERGVPFTMGDERYPACLGRNVSSAEPPPSLFPVLDLCDIPGSRVVKVSAGGYALGALTESGDLYCWGGGPVVPLALPVSGSPELVNGPEDKEIEDFAMGHSHMIAMARDGTVYVRGSNSNGQLGLGKDAGKFIHDWAQVRLSLNTGSHVVGVDAGPRASFILVSTQ